MKDDPSVVNQIGQIAARIAEMRDLCGMSIEEVSEKLDVLPELYRRYESGAEDIPIGVVYTLAQIFGIDSTTLLTGDRARMTDYTVVRAGKGIEIERFPGYSFSSLAINYIGRQMDPMIVTMSLSDKPAKLVTHPGQEFNYVLKGKIRVVIGEHFFDLDTGDSIYFNPMLPHGQRALSETAEFLTVING